MTTETARAKRDQVGSSWSLIAITSIVLFVIVVLLGFWAWRATRPSPARFSIATGAKQGSYHRLGEALGRVLGGEESIESAEEVITQGTLENLRLLGDESSERNIDFAFAQSDAAFGEDVRLVASLYDEYWHVLVSTKTVDSTVTSLEQVTGLPMWIGPEGSGTRAFSKRVLEHFGIDTKRAVSLPMSELGEALLDGRVGVAFVLTGLPSPMIRELCDDRVARFLSLGDAVSEIPGGEADAIHAVFPSIASTIIPRGVYGSYPEKPVRAILVSALLVTREDVDDDLVRTVTRRLFKKRARLIASSSSSGSGAARGGAPSVARHLRERYDPSRTILPYHEGAIAYYRRDRPHFFVEYADAISLGMTALVGVASLIISASQFLRRRRKNRIDAYYRQVEECATRLRSASSEELDDLRDRLEDIRSKAFADLVRERIEANESFIIFQDFLREEVASIDRRIEKEERSV